MITREQAMDLHRGQVLFTLAGEQIRKCFVDGTPQSFEPGRFWVPIKYADGGAGWLYSADAKEYFISSQEAQASIEAKRNERPLASSVPSKYWGNESVTVAKKLLNKVDEADRTWKVQYLDAEGHEGMQTVHADSQSDAAAIAKRTNPEIRSIQSVELAPDSQAFGHDE